MFTLLLIGAPVVLAAQLPDPFAVHWNFNGQPDGELAPALFGLLMGAIVGITWAVTRPLVDTPVGPLVLRLTYAMCGLSVATSLCVLWANNGVTRWQDARHFNVLLVLVLVLTAMGLGLRIGWFFEEEVARPDPSPSAEPPHQ